MDILIVILLIICIAVSTLALLRKTSNRMDNSRLEERLIRLEGQLDKLSPKIETGFRENRQEIGETLQGNRREISESLQNSRKEISDNLQQIQKTVDLRVRSLQDDNAKKLEEMRQTVDEKLQKSVEKRFSESFKQISGQLSQVYQGLGEMKTLANGVGDLKKVMEGVKTRGIYGEVQLGNIISDSMNAEQYEENFVTKKGSSDRVEFAVKMPGKNDQVVYLPIDSKFPVENYSRLVAAYEVGEKVAIEQYRKELANDVKVQAKKISNKYLDPPLTTDFGIMFVPTESLYAEILRIPGLFDEIRQKHNVTICSPSTLPVILSGLTMGFRTLAIEKRSAEVWQTLGAVKAQFGKFGDLLAATKKKLEETANKIGSAETTSRQIERKLKSVETLPEAESVKLIGEVEEW